MSTPFSFQFAAISPQRIIPQYCPLPFRQSRDISSIPTLRSRRDYEYRFSYMEAGTDMSSLCILHAPLTAAPKIQNIEPPMHVDLSALLRRENPPRRVNRRRITPRARHRWADLSVCICVYSPWRIHRWLIFILSGEVPPLLLSDRKISSLQGLIDECCLCGCVGDLLALRHSGLLRHNACLSSVCRGNKIAGKMLKVNMECPDSIGR